MATKKPTLEELIQQLNDRYHGKKRRIVVKTDGFGHFWTEWETYQE
jgi:hypothetical protein